MPRSTPERKLTRAELREIAVRRRDDGDVKALLWEIKRLHDVVARAEKLACGLSGYAENLNQRCLLDQLRELFEDEPALTAPQEPAYGKRKPARPSENEGERRARWDREEREERELDEREAKRRAREERG